MPDSLFGPPTITGPSSIPLTLLSMTASEGLGRCFELVIDVISEKDDIGAKDVVGQMVRVDVEIKNFQVRSFHGFVARLEYRGQGTGAAIYRLVARPWLWFLTQTQNCRVFQNISTKDILTGIFEEYGGAVDLSALGAYPAREYVVQYRESDFHFVMRLMESEGIYYYFRHEQDKHTMVLVDAFTAHVAVPDYDMVPFMPPDPNRTALMEHVSGWTVFTEAVPGSYLQRDFDFTKANVVLQSPPRSLPKGHALDGHEPLLDSPTLDAHLPDKPKVTRMFSEVYDYPGGFQEIEDPDPISVIRLEQLQVGYKQASAVTNARGLAVGHTFKLTGHPREDQNQDYLIVTANSRVSGQDSSTGGGSDQTFACSFTAIEPTAPFRMQPATAKPLMAGPQTATVVGPDKSEICTDEYGRVKVQFHWDRYGANNENSSCFVRVSQIWAGSGWGAVFTPRIGQEVIVDFLEGDPDQPIIVGRVHDSLNKPPYDPSKHPTVSGIRSHSSPKGNHNNFNEIRFEDRKGQEDLYVQAENSQTTLVKGSQSIDIGGNRTRTVKLDDTTTVHGDVNHLFDGMQTVKVGNDRIIIVTKDQFLRTKDGSITLAHGDSQISIAKGEDTTIVTKNASILVTQSGDVKITNSDGTVAMYKGDSMEITNTSGKLTISQVKNTIVFTDGKISIQANDKVEIQAKEVEITGSQDVKISGAQEGKSAAGAASVDLTPSGATVTAPMIKLNS
jgi:type VI secretion system secreted protein VgrG